MDRKATGGLPFVGAMTDGVDFMRKLWGVTGLPGLPTATGLTQFAQGLPQALPSMITPTLDVEELDKRIADLRAIEQWLALNANMLRATIQSLEVQRNTIATLKSFGGSMLSTMRGGAHAGGALAGSMAPPASTNPYLAGKSAAAAPVPSPAPAAAAPRTKAPPRPRARKKAAAAGAGMPLNPALWWGALHDQFTKVAAAASAAAAEPTAGAKAGIRSSTAGAAGAARDTAPAKPARSAPRARKPSRPPTA